MVARGGVRLQPIAALCALVLLVWGLLETASVVAQIQINDRFDLWPSTLDSWGSWMTILGFAAAVIGVPAILLAVLGLRSRAALHVGALVVLGSIAMTFVWMLIDVEKFDNTWSAIRQHYWDAIVWREPEGVDIRRWWFFVNDVVLPLAVLVLLLWLVVLLTGAGRRASAPASVGYAYAVAPQEDYRYVIDQDSTAAPEQNETGREVPATTEGRDVPAPLGAVVSAEAAAQPEPAAHSEPPQAGPEPSELPADHERVWFVTVQGSDHGPYSRTQLQAYVDEGRLHAGTITHLAGEPDQALVDVLR